MGTHMRLMDAYGERLKWHPDGDREKELSAIASVIEEFIGVGDDLSDIVYAYEQGGAKGDLMRALWKAQREQANRIDRLLKLLPDDDKPGDMTIQHPAPVEPVTPTFTWRYNPAPNGIGWDAMPITLESGSTDIPPGDYALYLDRENHRWIAKPYGG